MALRPSGRDTPSAVGHARVLRSVRTCRALAIDRCDSLQIEVRSARGRVIRAHQPAHGPVPGEHLGPRRDDGRGTSLAARRRMDTFVDEPTARFVSRSAALDDATRLLPAVTRAHSIGGWRKAALLASLVAVPALVGVAWARARPRRGLLAGGITALAFGALRIELARWFTPEPAYRLGSKLGDLELRHCAARVEAVTEIEDSTLEAALDHGYGRLVSYICGAN